MKTVKLCLIGCTGSIGTQTADVVRTLNADGYDFRITAMAFFSNYQKAGELIKEFRPLSVAVISEKAAKALSSSVDMKGIELLIGENAAINLCKTADYDICVNAAVGISGLLPSHEVLKRGKRLALANKETIVTDGENIMKAAKAAGTEIIPLDSEHSAIFQCLRAGNRDDVEKLIITASGGPFFGKTAEYLSSVTASDALKHPTWSMGRKVTVDSSTLVNKGFEVIEASRLFAVPPEKIRIIIHRESVIHSMVEFRDGAVLAQLGAPDMRLPIQYGLVYPERPKNSLPRLSFADIGSFTFFKPDTNTFRGLALALQALKKGGNATAILNAADEVAVTRFLNGEITFTDIPSVIEASLEAIPYISSPSTADILDTDRKTREFLLTYGKL